MSKNAWAALAGESSDSSSEEGTQEQSEDNSFRTAEEPSKEENNNPEIQPPTKKLTKEEEKSLIEMNPHTRDTTLNTATSALEMATQPPLDTATQPPLKSKNTSDTNCMSTRTSATKNPDTKQPPKTVTRVSIPSRPTQTVPQKIRKGLINTNSLDEAMRVLKSLRPVPKLVVLAGLPGSGKSRVCDNCFRGWNIISQDREGTRRICEAKVRTLWSLPKRQNRRRAVRVNPNSLPRIVIDRCNFDVKQRKTWINFAAQVNLVPSHAVCLWLHVPAQTCITRAKNRKNHPTLAPRDANKVVGFMLKKWQDPTLAEGFSTIVKISAHKPTSSGSARVSKNTPHQRVLTRSPPRKQPTANAWKKPTINTASRNKMQKHPTRAPVRTQTVPNAWGKPTIQTNAWRKPRSQDHHLLRTREHTTQHRQQPPQQHYPRQQQRYQRRPNPIPAAAPSPAPPLNSTDAPLPQRVHRQPSASSSASRSPWGGFAGPHPTPTQAWKWPRQTYMQSSFTPDAAPAAPKSQPEPPPPIPLPNMLRRQLSDEGKKLFSMMNGLGIHLPVTPTSITPTSISPDSHSSPLRLHLSELRVQAEPIATDVANHQVDEQEPDLGVLPVQVQRQVYLTPRFARLVQQRVTSHALAGLETEPLISVSATSARDRCQLVGLPAASITYVGLFITDEAREALLGSMHVRFPSRVVEAMHVTLEYQPELSAQSLNRFPALGVHRKVKVLGLGSNYRVQAVSVSRGDLKGLEPVYQYVTKNTLPHITVSLARYAYPSDSNKMLQNCVTGGTLDEEAACAGLELDAYIGYVVKLGSHAWPVFDRDEAEALLGLRWEKALLDTPDWSKVGNREGSTKSFVGNDVRRTVVRAVMTIRKWLDEERAEGLLMVQGPFSSLEQTLILDAACQLGLEVQDDDPSLGSILTFCKREVSMY